MNKETLKYVLRQATERPLPRTRPRTQELPLESGKVVTLTGVRRTGKTFLMFETMRRLLEAGVDRRQILYLDLSDDRLYPVRLEEMDQILAAHAELYQGAADAPRYLFLDEVQEVGGWERYVRRVYDTEDVHVFVTGSSAHLLTRDLAPALRGRSIGFEVFPLSFLEFTEFRGLDRRPHHRGDEIELRRALEEYVQWGGLPEIVLADDALRPLILKEYAALLFHRDLVERYGVRNEPALKLLLRFCAARPAALVSIHKLHRDFRSRGIQLSKNTLYEYLEHLEDAYVAYTLALDDPSERRRSHNPKKVFLVDPALGRALVVPSAPNRGAWLENLVYLHERRRTRDITYLSNAYEVDLVVRSETGVRYLNVAWTLSDPETLARERAAMAYGAARHPDGEGLLVAHEADAAAEAVPAFRFLLQH